MSDTLSQVYSYQDFTQEKYHKLLELAAGKYRFSTYNDNPGANDLVWRHDVDFSLQRALKLAEIEKSVGVISHYFFMLTSQYYNLLAPSGAAACREIANLGHTVAFHYEAPSPEAAGVPVEQHIEQQADIFRKCTGFDPQYLSFHNPTTVPADVLDKDRLGGMLNVYGVRTKASYQYFSDSNGYWKYGSMQDFLTQAHLKPLHVLTHPVWWSEYAMSPFERIKSDIESWGQYGISLNNDLLKALNRKNVGLEE